MTKDWLKNVLIILPLVIIGGVASFYLWQDYVQEHATEEQQHELHKIGVISSASQNIKRKSLNSLYWNDVESGDSVFSSDSIRTGANAFANIQLFNSSEIELSENSLITLQETGQDLSVNFKAGDMQAKSGSKKLSIQVNNSTLSAQNAEIKLKTGSDSRAEITVQKGSATLKGSDNKITELSKEKLLKIDETGKSESFELVVVLNTPKDKAVILDDKNEIKYPFTWNVLNENTKDQIFELSPSPKFTKDKTFTRLAQRAINAPLNKGISYWRVGWKSGDKIQYSETRTITVKEDRRITLLEPQHQAIIHFTPQEEEVSFAWKSEENVRLFVLEVSKNKDFTELVSTQTLSKNNFVLNGLKEGAFWWRVQAYNVNNEVVGKSLGFQFNIKRMIPQLPVLKSPSNGSLWTLSDPLLFEWQALSEAKNYKVKITSDVTQKNILKSIIQTGTSYLWKWEQPGVFYWSVEALNEKNEVIGQSVIYKNQISPTILGPAIALLTPENQSTVTRERRDPIDPVVFTWKLQKPLQGNFTLLIAKSPDFKDAVKKDNITGTRYALRLNISENYYWKILWQDPTDISKREESATFVLKFRMSSKLPAPVLVEPLHEARKFVADKQSLDFSWYKAVDAESYHIVLERVNTNTNETIPVMDRITKEQKIKSPPLEPGLYRWTVSSLDKENIEGPTGEMRTFTVEVKKELTAPKLNTPLVK